MHNLRRYILKYTVQVWYDGGCECGTKHMNLQTPHDEDIVKECCQGFDMTNPVKEFVTIDD